VARAPLLPVDPGDAHREVLAGLLLEAVRFAARSLAAVCADDVRAGGRLATTVRAYEQRARTRPTPRGAFAGVQLATLADGPTRFVVGANHRPRSGPSAAWLSEVASRLIEEPAVLAALRLWSHDLVVRRGDRFEHEHATGTEKPERITLRATPAVELILDTCRDSARFDEVVCAVADRWPQIPEATVRTAIAQMVRKGFLLTDLVPDDAANDPLGHLLTKLPEPHQARAALTAIRDLLADADRRPVGTGERLNALENARILCDTVAHQECPLSVDVALDGDIQVPSSLADEAVDAAGLLWSIMPSPMVLGDYHERFVERYGVGRRVDLMAVVDPVTGLGGPEAADDREAAEDKVRGRVLSGLLAEAAARGAAEVTLDEATITALRVESPGVPPSTGELYAQVFAASSQDVEAGRFELAVYMGCTQDAASSLGRFAKLLGLRGPLTTAAQGAVPAEVVVRPRLAGLSALAPPSGFTRRRICVGLPARPGDLRLSDLELASDGQRLALWSRSLEREIAPALYSRIGSAYLPPAARLLQDLAHSGGRPWRLWSWGPLAQAPFLPRVRWRRTILSPARWRLPHPLVAAVGGAARWETELERWRSATVPGLPRVVVVQEADQRIPLDLDDQRDRDLLRRYVRRGAEAVTEEPGGAEAIQGVAKGPDGGHALELVIPFQRGRSTAAPSRRRPPASSKPVVHLPGGRWLSVAIPAPAVHHDDLLPHVDQLVRELREYIDHWFWLRYDNRAHGPHVRVRFAGESAVLLGRVLPAVSARCAALMEQGLAGGPVVEPYEPEVDRYGDLTTIEAAEDLFHADSDLSLRLLAQRPDGQARLVLAALSAVALARELADGDPDAVGRPRLDRAARRQVNDLRAIASSGPAALLEDNAQQAWDHRGRAAAVYRSVLPAARRAECISSVIHMHANRMGLGHDEERVARALAAQLQGRATR
jgi:lantibiotic biosynthesis protein